MGRPPINNKPPTTTVLISKDLWGRIRQKKWKGTTMDQFLSKVFTEWIDHKDAFQILELTNQSLEKRIEDYDQTLDELKTIANVQTIVELKSKLYRLNHLTEQTSYVTN